MRSIWILAIFLGTTMALDDASRAPHAVQVRAESRAGHAFVHERSVVKRAEGKAKKSKPKTPGQRPDPPRFPGGGRG